MSYTDLIRNIENMCSYLKDVSKNQARLMWNSSEDTLSALRLAERELKDRLEVMACVIDFPDSRESITRTQVRAYSLALRKTIQAMIVHMNICTEYMNTVTGENKDDIPNTLQ